MSSSLCLAPALGLGVEWGRVEAHDGVALSHDGELLELFHLGWLVGLLQEPLAQGILHRKQGWVNNNHRRRVWYDCTRAIWRKGWIAPGWYEGKDEFNLFFNSSWCKITSAARHWINSVPQTAATSFAFLWQRELQKLLNPHLHCTPTCSGKSLLCFTNNIT